MRAQTWDISNDTGWANFTAQRNSMVLAGKRPKAQFMPEKRSLDQNAMSFALYGQIAAQCEDQSLGEIRAECKLNIGVPILREANAEFHEHCLVAIDPLNYEQQIKAMKWTPVTSKMGVKAFSLYMDEVIREYSVQGYSLTHPSEAA